VSPLFCYPLLSAVIHPMSSGSQGWVWVLGCSLSLGLPAYSCSGHLLLFIVIPFSVIVAPSPYHPCPCCSSFPLCEQLLTVVVDVLEYKPGTQSCMAVQRRVSMRLQSSLAWHLVFVWHMIFYFKDCTYLSIDGYYHSYLPYIKSYLLHSSTSVHSTLTEVSNLLTDYFYLTDFS
jgi:hypothetical protein